MPPRETTKPKYSTLSLKKFDFSRATLILASYSLSKTHAVFQMFVHIFWKNNYVIDVDIAWFPYLFSEHIVASSLKNGGCILQFKGQSTEFVFRISYWEGSLSFSASNIWWKPDFKSKVVKYFALPKLARMKTTFGIGYLSSTVFKLSFLKSIKRRFFVFPCSSVPFLSTTQAGLLYGDRDGQFMASRNTACVSVFTKSTYPSGMGTILNILGLHSPSG